MRMQRTKYNPNAAYLFSFALAKFNASKGLILKTVAARFVRRSHLQIMLLELAVLANLVGILKKRYLSPIQPFSLSLLQSWPVELAPVVKSVELTFTFYVPQPVAHRLTAFVDWQIQILPLSAFAAYLPMSRGNSCR